MQQFSVQGHSTVVVVDAMVLRRSGWISLLRGWAQANGVGLAAIAPDAIKAAAPPGSRCALGLLSLGSLSLLDPLSSGWLRRMQEALVDAPIAVISDSEATEEIVAAFRAGARGFLSTTIAPEIALEAFSFIMRGGSFFPPGPILEKLETRCRTRPADGAREQDGRDAGALHSLLTSRQLDVLLHLQTGKSNKAIARLLGMQEATVKVHVRQLMRKLGAVNRTQAALSALGAAFGRHPPANDDSPAAGMLGQIDSTGRRRAAAAV